MPICTVSRFSDRDPGVIVGCLLQSGHPEPHRFRASDPGPMRFVSYFPSSQAYFGPPLREKVWPEGSHGNIALSFPGSWQGIGVSGIDGEGDVWSYAWSRVRWGYDAEKNPPVWVRLRDFLERP